MTLAFISFRLGVEQKSLQWQQKALNVWNAYCELVSKKKGSEVFHSHVNNFDAGIHLI